MSEEEEGAEDEAKEDLETEPESENKYKPEDCEVKHRLRYGCLCPKDYYGKYC